MIADAHGRWCRVTRALAVLRVRTRPTATQRSMWLTNSSAPGPAKFAQQSGQTFSALMTCTGKLVVASGQPDESLEPVEVADCEFREGVRVAGNDAAGHESRSDQADVELEVIMEAGSGSDEDRDSPSGRRPAR